ncbi:PucR family transcriptional regulator [Paenibacillus yonginensis]|uniref:PucR family transcriptional regulator n=1 Tax=Paenibacillus yonginensis TaxID=1462996 RepID=UPI000838C6D2|nr:helix-turn-helix domain-containing protein [Paenibacillus yonginensis]
MNMIDLRHRIEQIIDAPLSENSIPWPKWLELGGNESRQIGLPLIIDGVCCWPWSFSEDYVNVWEIDPSSLQDSESQLIELLLQTAANQVRPSQADKDNEEAAVLELGAWLRTQLKEDLPQEIVPDRFVLKKRLSEASVPFLLSSESRTKPHMQYQKLNKLLKSYFGADLLLIPVEEQEWLILVGEGQLEDLRQVSEESREAERAMLGDLGQGVYELIANEWVGNFHISVAQPVIPEQSLVEVTELLRETLILGKMFHVSEQIHLPWNFYLERLVYSIPDKQRKQFMARTDIAMGIFNDPETLSTLETFFLLDCNVSETAKRLYIHRNTLLYRMDKIKQETGLDVRSFKDAVLVKLTLLLYKVTKRK